MIFLFCLFASIAGHAAVTPLAGASLEFGGDTLVEATYSDGSRSNIPAGRGLGARAGALLDLYEGFGLEGSLGFKWTSVKPATNGAVSWVRFPFELLSDSDEAACKAFSVIKMKNMYGRKVRGIERSTFVIDAAGIVRREWRGVKVPGHAQEVLAFVRTLK